MPYNDVISIIPARGGSKRIPRKNLVSIGGLPIIARTVLDSVQSKRVKETYVSTDHPEIAAVAEKYGARVVTRPPELSIDTAPSESALLHVLDWRNRSGLKDPDLIVFLACTSPLRRRGDIDGAVDALIRAGADSLFSACRFNKLVWTAGSEGPRPLNYDYRRRQREQEMAPQYMENGSIYVFKPEILRRENNRLGGKIAIYEMDPLTSFQVDEPWEVSLQEWILREHLKDR